LILFAAITKNFGNVLGVPYLFLDPEYLNKVGFRSFFIMVCAIGLFTMAFHITTYIIDGPRFRFLGALSKPFAKFSLNNSIIPVIFILTYIFNVIQFQRVNELNSNLMIAKDILGFLSGIILITGILFLYFRATNKDIFKVIASQVNEQMKKTGIARSNIMQRYRYDRQLEIRIDSYL
jgi:hypothetical protein